MKIAVLGAGNSGLSSAGHLAALGHDVSLFKNGNFEEDDNRLKDELAINMTGSITGCGRIKCFTGNVDEALSGSELIITAFPAFCRSIFLEKLVPHLKAGQTVLLMPDNYGSRDLNKMLSERGLYGKVTVAGINTCIYACRKLDYNKVIIKGIKKNVLVYSETADSKYLCGMLNKLLNIFVPGESAEKVVLSNINCIIHVPAAVMNTGWIEHTAGNFDFYSDGITESVSKIIGKADNERIAVGNSLNIKLDGIIESVYINYGIKYDNIYEALSGSFIHSGAMSPPSMNNRYITEDVPYGLVPISKYGKAMDIPTPIIDSLICLAKSVINI